MFVNMDAWKLHQDLGIRMLARHHEREAVHYLRQAMDSCPPDRAAELHRICFYLGIALRRSGHPQTAVRSWLSCTHLRKRGYSRRMLERLLNGYGMARQATANDDDWQAFRAIQLSRYLATRNKRAFSTDAERDMVSDLIRDYWRTVERSGATTGMDASRKRDYFLRMRIVFPTVVLPETAAGVVVAVNFRTRQRISDTQTCLCGSGLPYAFCCGRTKSCEELMPGIF
jgi:hypothetical protein